MNNSHSKIVIFILAIMMIGCNNDLQFTINDGLLISNATIISANENEEIVNYIGHVLVDADTIVYAGTELPTLNGSYKIINATNKFIIPGLIDSHVHIGHVIALKDEHYETRPDLIKAYNQQLPKSYLYFGFTTLIDLDLRDTTRKQFEKASIRPDLYGTSRGVRYLNGYGQSFFPDNVKFKIFPKWIYDSSQATLIPRDIDLSKHSVSSVVEQTIEENAMALKTYYEKGFGGAFNWPVPSDSLLINLVNNAHSKQLPVVMHTTSLDAYKKGLVANIDIFGHSLWHWEGDNLNTIHPDEVSLLYQEIAKKGKYIQSTMRVILGEYDTYTWSLINHPDLKHVLSNTFVKWLESEAGRWPQKELQELYSKLKQDKKISNIKYFLSFNERVKQTTKLAFDNDVKLILGSDTPASEGIGNVPGLNGFLEIQALSEAGLDNETIFKAATIRNAIAFNLQDTIGSIAKGKRANILILNSNPLLDISAYNTIETIIISGVPHKREKLSATYQGED
jgi:Amidohydrolase family